MEDEIKIIVEMLSEIHGCFREKMKALSESYHVIVVAREADHLKEVCATEEKHKARVKAEYATYRGERDALYLEYKAYQIMTDAEIHEMLRTRYAKFLEVRAAAALPRSSEGISAQLEETATSPAMSDRPPGGIA